MGKKNEANGRELTYCYEYAKTWNKAESYRTAFPKSNPEYSKQYACKLHKKPYIQEKIQEIVADSLGPKDKDLKDVIQFWRNKMNDPLAKDNAKLKASEMLAKYHNLFKEDSKVNVQATVQIVDDI